MNDKYLLIDKDQRGVYTVTLNNPEKHNAFDDHLIEDLTNALQSIAADPQARAMILASAGKSFCAGADVNWMKRMAEYCFEANLRDASALANMLHALNELPIPTIAKVQGAAYGGAVGLISCCDMAVVSTRARFCLSEVKIGLIPATISPYVIAAIGQRAARRYFNTAESFNATSAKDLGLASEVVDEEQLDSCINELLNHLLANSPAAIKASKQLITDIAGKEINQALIADTSERIASIRISAEGQQGLSAFLNKEPAPWLTN